MNTQNPVSPAQHLRKVLPLALLLVMTACSEGKKPATQVVAKVNNDEISIHQVNNALAHIPNVPVDSVDKVKKDVLAKLVNQQLAVQQAEAQKIDRSPEVMMQIDEARREILTRAYLNRLVAGLPKPSEDEARKFYQSHPELFSDRHVYKLQEIALETNNPPVADLKTFAQGKSMEDIAAWLKKQNIPFTMHSGTRAAEQIPLSVLPQLAAFKDGQTGIFEPTPHSAVVMHLESSQSAPVDEKTALEKIPRYLANEQAKVAIGNDLERLKTQAKIEYLGDFAAMSPNQAGTQPPVIAEAEKSPPAASPASAQPNNQQPKPETMNVEKAIAGLK